MMALISKTETYECDFCGTRGDTEPKGPNHCFFDGPEGWARLGGFYACPECLPKYRAYNCANDEWWKSRQDFEAPLKGKFRKKMDEWDEANPRPEPEDFGIKKPEVF